MERTLADLETLLSQQPFGSIEEANAYLQELLAGGGPPARTPSTPLERAQDLIYQASSTRSRRERIGLAREALAVSPDCADAYVFLADETARNAREAAALYTQGVAAGERALGEQRFKEDAGHFWGILDTRPYMRARLGLAVAQWEIGEHESAIDHLWEMLRLNPNDNQGVRYVLVKWLMERGDDGGLKELFRRYRDDAAAVWLYARALHGFRTEGNTARTRRLRDEALKENPHVPPYPLGQRRLPRHLPEMVGFGDESEAIDCAAAQRDAWRTTPGALNWLAGAAGQRA
jgi:tetratricopeptide (TPR) repeat protein